MMQGTMSLKYQKCCATQRTCPNGINSAETRTMLGAFLAWMAFVIEVPEVQKLNSFFWHVREICEQRLFASSRLSVRPYESTRLPVDDICTFVTISVHSWRYLYICDDICTFMTISVHLWRYLYIYDDICTFVTISVHLWQHLAGFFLEWEIFQTKFVQKIKKKTLFYCLFLKIVQLIR